MSRVRRPKWVEEEYERIGREREQASRESDRLYRWEFVRVCLEILGWTALGLVVAALGFHVEDRGTGEIYLYGGMVINGVGVLWSVGRAYKRGEDRGDW